MIEKRFVLLAAALLFFAAGAHGTAIGITNDPLPRTFNIPGSDPPKTLTSSGRINLHTDYVVVNLLNGLRSWEVNAIPLKSTTDSDFTTLKDLMTAQFSNWTLIDGSTELDGSNSSFVVHTYDAHTIDTRVGAELQVDFVTDYAPVVGETHWIQIITTDDGSIGKPVPRFDSLNGGQSPFTDNGYAFAGPDYFYDFPKGYYDVENRMNFYLFLVSGSPSGSTSATVLGGLEWGFENHCDGPLRLTRGSGASCSSCGCSTATPEASSFALLGLGLFVLVPCVLRLRRGCML